MKRFLILISAICLSFSLSAQTLLEMGQDAANSEDKEKAIEYFQQELSANPANGRAHFLVGMIYQSEDENGLALDSFTNALKYVNKKDKPSVYLCRGALFGYLGRCDEALADFNQAIKLDNKYTKAYIIRAHLYDILGNIDAADNDYKMALKLKPDDTECLLELASNAETRQNFDTAADYYDKAISISPDNGESYTARGSFYARQGMYDRFASDAIKALENGDTEIFRPIIDYASVAREPLMSVFAEKASQDPGSPLWPYTQATILEESKRYEEAIEYYLKAENIKPVDTVEKRIATCYNCLFKWDKALEWLDLAIKKDPDNVDYLMARAEGLFNSGDAEGALEAVNNCVEKHLDQHSLYSWRGWLEYQMKLYEEAILDYTEAIEMNPEDGGNYLMRGACYLHKGKNQKAEEDFQFVYALCSDADRGSEMVAYAYAYSGRAAEAEVEINKFLNLLDPDDEYVDAYYYDAASIYSLIGKTDQALEYLRIALDKGLTKYHAIMTDPNLENLRKTPGFKELINVE